MTEKEENNNSEKLLTNETENIHDEIDEKEHLLALKDEEDDFKGYTKLSKFLLFFLFFWIGIINHLGTILVMNGGRLLAFELGMKDYIQIYTSIATIFAVATRLINSKLCLKVSYKKRIYLLSLWFMIGYLSMFGVLQLHETVLDGYNVLCFVLSFIPCFFLGSSYAFGEAAMVAYLRLFPKTLIAGWSSGTGLSGLISGGLNLTSQLIDGFSLKYLYLFLFPVGVVYLLLFICTFRILKAQERRIEREERNSNPNLAIMRDTNYNKNKDEQVNEEDRGETAEEEHLDQNQDEKLPVNNEVEEDAKSIKEAEDKELEDMNKANQVFSRENFKKVMHMVGRVLINLGLIYFLQFFCVNTLLISVCAHRDIGFLPFGCQGNSAYRRGKFEFINLSYQIGMFLSKTLIKIVRKIQPIEVYTITILIINIIYIIEYYADFIPWQVYLHIGLILGFFAGGTYAGGFYTILNSKRVPKNYKELTVNIATIFNDSGTFLSGIVGYLLYNSLFEPKYPDINDKYKCPDK